MTASSARSSSLFFALLLLVLAACGGADMMDSISTAEPSSGMESRAPMAESTDDEDGGDSAGGGTGGELPAPVERKIVYNSTVKLVLKKTSLEQFEKDIEALIEKHQAYKIQRHLQSQPRREPLGYVGNPRARRSVRRFFGRGENAGRARGGAGKNQGRHRAIRGS
jgi:hypothetical protein